jgi:hypothetical protein
MNNIIINQLIKYILDYLKFVPSKSEILTILLNE